MFRIVSDSFPRLQHSSSVSGCFKIYFLLYPVSMTWSCFAVKKPSVSANKSAFVSQLFDASMSTYCWLSSYGWRPCKAFWDFISWLCYYILHLWGSSFAFARTKSSGVHLSSAITTAAWRDDVTCLFKKYDWRSFTCLSCSRVILINQSINPLPLIAVED